MSEPLQPLRPSQLRWSPPPSERPQSPDAAVHQRARSAIELGLTMATRPAAHVFCAGEPGSGRRALLRSVLHGRGPRSAPRDLVLVHDLERPERPYWLTLAAGSGPELIEAVKRLAQRVAADPAGRGHARRITTLRKRFPSAERLFEQLVADLARFRAELAIDANAAAPAYHDVAQLIVTRDAEAPLPVVWRPELSAAGLFGGAEPAHDHDPSPFPRVSGGALLEADGGVLVIDACELEPDGEVWLQLKRALRQDAVVLQGLEQRAMLRAEPLPLGALVVLVGTSERHQQLIDGDPEARQLVPLLADLDDDLAADAAGVAQLAALVGELAAELDVGVTPDGMAMVAWLCARWAPDPGRLAMPVAALRWLLAGARQLADGGELDAQAIEGAWRDSRRRGGAAHELLLREIASGVVAVELTGHAVGQVNGLVTIEVGDHAYGLPARISASAGPGVGGLVNIERQVALSGSLHDKGVLLLGGLLRMRWGQTRPLCFSATLAFEQSGQPVDGDSASLAEAIALVSAISGLPLRQDLALSGSVDQRGGVGAVGEVEAKIEGFDQALRQAGRQGVVVIPASGGPPLLTREVVERVEQGALSIYAVRRFEQALELAFDRPLAEIDAAVEAALDRFAEASRGLVGAL